MNINELLKGVKCSCGRTHICNIESVYIEKNAIARLSELCSNYSTVLLVADENTWGVAGEKCEEALSDKKIKKLIFSGKSLLIPDENAIAAVENELSGVDLIIGIGSGVVQDLSKCVSYLNSLPYMVVATAPSMDGYASNGAAMILKGMKETVSAGVPRAIVADTKILAEAPFEMIKAGYGDIIGKYSALSDWKLSTIVNGEYFCDYIYDTTYGMIDKVREESDGLLMRREESVGALMEALVTVGIMMSFLGSSRPASGSEHHLSHFFEIVGLLNGEDYFPHGIDVAYSTVITAKIREKIAEKSFTGGSFRLPRDEYEKKIGSVYGKIAKECIALQDKVGNYATDRSSVYLANEEKIKSLLKEGPTSNEINEMLLKLGLDISEFYRAYGEEKIKNAVSYAKDLKDRYSVLWLNYDLFGEEK